MKTNKVILIIDDEFIILESIKIQLGRFLNEESHIVEFASSSPARMVPACAQFYDAVVSGKLTHDGNPLLTRHFQNAVIKTDRLGPRIVKEHRASPRKIDAAVASIIGFSRATLPIEEPVVPQFFSF
jgi:phage terminase large subunit-like protein